MSERRYIEAAAKVSADLHNPSVLDKLEGTSRGLDHERMSRKTADEALREDNEKLRQQVADLEKRLAHVENTLGHQIWEAILGPEKEG